MLCISGNYTCEVEWGGQPISITHKLTVLVPPSIEAVLPGGLGQVDHPIEAREGSQVRLECRAEGIPPPIVRWRSPVSNKCVLILGIVAKRAANFRVGSGYKTPGRVRVLPKI